MGEQCIWLAICKNARWGSLRYRSDPPQTPDHFRAEIDTYRCHAPEMTTRFRESLNYKKGRRINVSILYLSLLCSFLHPSRFNLVYSSKEYCFEKYFLYITSTLHISGLSLYILHKLLHKYLQVPFPKSKLLSAAILPIFLQQIPHILQGNLFICLCR